MSHSAHQTRFLSRPLRAVVLLAGAALGGTALAVAALGVAALAPAAARAASDKGQHVYRWVDEKGVVHYGDRVPPQ